VREAGRAYRETNDWLSAFLQECWEIGEDYQERSGDLYQEYRAYCARMGEYARRSQDFVAALEAAGFTRKKTRQCNYILGLRLNDSFRKEEEYV
jgi:phage/plasmid-associated DNA primase